jgi:hypothetical protein
MHAGAGPTLGAICKDFRFRPSFNLRKRERWTRFRAKGNIMSEFNIPIAALPRSVAAAGPDGKVLADTNAAGSSKSSREIAQKRHQLAEFNRRNMLAQLRKTLHPLVKDWWWARDESLSAIHECFRASGTHCVIDQFMGEEASLSIRAEVLRAHSMHLLDTPGVLGGGERGVASQSFVDRQVRSDSLGWFDCTAQPSKSVVDMACRFSTEDAPSAEQSWPHLQSLLARIETLIVELGSTHDNPTSSGLGGKGMHAAGGGARAQNDFSACSTRSRCMVTCYPGQDSDESRYSKHYDNANCNGRRVTCIYYVNTGWKRTHGGALRLYTRSSDDFDDNHGDGDDEDRALITDVEPTMDRLVLFYSDTRVLHEVLPTHRDRFAFTVWFFDKVERAKVAASSAGSSDAITATTAATTAAATTAAEAQAEP